jgi:alpha-glucan phosphorylase-like protein
MHYNDSVKIFPETARLANNPVAYFCAEFALSDELPIYSGGLGVLAGDVVREAERSKLPFVAVGLFYKEGYFTQVITDAGLQNELPAYHDISNLPIAPLTNADGTELRVVLHVANRTIHLKVWKYTEGVVAVYLLDSDVAENSELDRRLTLSLYPTDNEWRIQQEIVLGIGGARLLHQLGIQPSVYHLNEGHSAFAVLEISYQYMQATKADFPTALAYAKQRIVFTNHTLIPSGNDVFHTDMVAALLGQHAEHMGLPVDAIVAMGKITDQENSFSMTHLALHSAHKVSAVSRTHAEFAKKNWPDTPLLPITNGVSVPYWQQPSWQHIAEKLEREFEVTSEHIWRAHLLHKEELLDTVMEATGVVLKPEALTITWARRIAAYKQPLLLFSDMERLKSIVEAEAKPVQIILAGKAHPADATAKAMISDILRILDEYDLEDNIVFVPNYNLELAHLLVSGSDVWLNTPIKGQEACGTSGMKAALNGVLQCAISDGWTDEIPLDQLGFSIDPINSAQSLYNMLEQRVVPLYYAQNEYGFSEDWVSRMCGTVLMASKQYSAERMLAEYIEKLYVPVLQS